MQSNFIKFLLICMLNNLLTSVPLIRVLGTFKNSNFVNNKF